MGKYYLDKVGSEFILLEDWELLCKFTRDNVRKVLEGLGRSTGWVGHMIRRLNEEFPLPSPGARPRAAEDYSVQRRVDYLRSKGYEVYEPIPVPDHEIISSLTRMGYAIEREQHVWGPYAPFLSRDTRGVEFDDVESLLGVEVTHGN